MRGRSVISSIAIMITCANYVCCRHISGRVLVCGGADPRPLGRKSSGLEIRLSRALPQTCRL